MSRAGPVAYWNTSRLSILRTWQPPPLLKKWHFLHLEESAEMPSTPHSKYIECVWAASNDSPYIENTLK